MIGQESLAEKKCKAAQTPDRDQQSGQYSLPYNGTRTEPGHRSWESNVWREIYQQVYYAFMDFAI